VTGRLLGLMGRLSGVPNEVQVVFYLLLVMGEMLGGFDNQQ
jgi:hypothetical protein